MCCLRDGLDEEPGVFWWKRIIYLQMSDHYQGDFTNLHSACCIPHLQFSPQVSSTASLLAASCRGLCNLRASSEPHEELSARVWSSDSWRRDSERQNSRLPRGWRRAWRGGRNTSNTRRESKTCAHVLLESRDGGNEWAIRAAEEMTAALHIERRLKWAYDLLMLSRDSWEDDLMILMNKMLNCQLQERLVKADILSSDILWVFLHRVSSPE